MSSLQQNLAGQLSKIKKSGRTSFEFVAYFAEGVDKCRVMRIRFDFVSQCGHKTINTAMP